ncbi:MAG: zf-HC2 domain-containing protein [Spirochaetaceae bacterium]|nr:zf-HC2 domain-containing protein [Spirochaetaceae bacterium]
MCPDHEVLSVYLDGELPSPWKEKMEQHLAECAECRDRLGTYREVSRILNGVSDGQDSAFENRLASARTRVQARLREKLEKSIYAGVPETRPSPVETHPSLWRRRLSIPFPAAAAVLLLILAAAFFASRPLFTPPRQDQMAGIESDIQDIIPVSDMSRALQYLGSQNTDGDIVIIRLPESRNFASSGEPTLIRAVDYSRRNQSR